MEQDGWGMGGGGGGLEMEGGGGCRAGRPQQPARPYTHQTPKPKDLPTAVNFDAARKRGQRPKSDKRIRASDYVHGPLL